MKVRITLSTEITVQFDEKSQDFKDLLKGYNEAICDADEEDLAKHVAEHICRYGTSEYMEGVGLVKENGEKQTNYQKEGAPEDDCPINVIAELDLNGHPEFEIDFVDIIEEED